VFVFTGGKTLHLVPDFGGFQPVDFTTAPSAGGESVFVSLVVRFSSDAPFSRLQRWTVTGKKTGEWALRQVGRLAGVAVDASQQIVYCSDSRLGQIYQVDLKSKQPVFATLAK